MTRHEKILGSSRRDLTGQRFGHLIVVAAGLRGRWIVRCVCGNFVELRQSDLGKRRTSCGCFAQKGTLTHGASVGRKPTPEFRSWVALRKRVRRDERGYATRGITVAKRWSNFALFLADMGPMPQKEGVRYTVERKNNNRGYTPGNCVWATPTEQARNKRNNHLVTYKRRTQTLAAWAEETGLPYGALKIRLRAGWPVSLALTTPSPAPHLRDANNNKFVHGRGHRQGTRT